MIHMRHIRQVKMCSGGARAFFERHDLDWSDFLKNGVPIETIRKLNDHMGNRVCEVAENERRK